MNMDQEIITELKNKITELENQNRLLRQHLTEAGISFADIILILYLTLYFYSGILKKTTSVEV